MLDAWRCSTSRANEVATGVGRGATMDAGSEDEAAASEGDAFSMVSFGFTSTSIASGRPFPAGVTEPFAGRTRLMTSGRGTLRKRQLLVRSQASRTNGDGLDEDDGRSGRGGGGND
jgi:hypothetical protein